MDTENTRQAINKASARVRGARDNLSNVAREALTLLAVNEQGGTATTIRAARARATTAERAAYTQASAVADALDGLSENLGRMAAYSSPYRALNSGAIGAG